MRIGPQIVALLLIPLEPWTRIAHSTAMVPFLFCHQEIFLCPSGALWWPAESALLVADMHLEKAGFFARLGQFLPPYDSYETALRLSRAIEETGARRVLCLGDSFHAADGAESLEGRAAALLRESAAGREWLWISGNHDVLARPRFGETVADLHLQHIWLRHEAVPQDGQPEISGHFHPKLRLRHKGQSISRRCFVASATKLLMPAFGSLAGGLDVRHPAIRAALGEEIEALVPGQKGLMRIPVHCMSSCQQVG